MIQKGLFREQFATTFSTTTEVTANKQSNGDGRSKFIIITTADHIAGSSAVKTESLLAQENILLLLDVAPDGHLEIEYIE